MQPPAREISRLSRIDDSIATADSDHQTSLGYSNSLVLSQVNVAWHSAARRGPLGLVAGEKTMPLSKSLAKVCA